MVAVGPTHDLNGYAAELRDMLPALTEIGARVRLEALQLTLQQVDVPAAQQQSLERYAAAEFNAGERYVRVWHYLPQFYRGDESASAVVGRSIHRTDCLPRYWVDGCNRVDLVWVPSHFSFGTFAGAGLPCAKLRVLPTCVDVARVRSAAPVDGGSGRSFNFLSIGQWHSRDGWDVLIRSFVREFQPDEDVALVLKANGDIQSVAAAVQRLVEQEVGVRLVPPIRLHCGIFPRPAIDGLLRSCQAYVHPNRGTGWGHDLMAAMAAGLPCIATRWGDHLEFAADTNSYLLEHKLTEVPEAVLSEQPAWRGHRWAEPSVDHLRALMRQVFNARLEATERGARAANDIAAGFDAQVIARKFVTLCQEAIDLRGRKRSSAGGGRRHTRQAAKRRPLEVASA